MAGVKRTVVAEQAVDLARMFGALLGRQQLAGHHAVLMAPESVSTGGGVQARQSLVLQNPQGRSVAVGWLNVATKTCALRTYDCVVTMHKQRFQGRPLPIDRDSYQGFLQRVAEFAKTLGMQVTFETQPPEMELLPSRMPPPPGNTGAIVAVVMVLLLVLAVALYLLRDRLPF